MHAKSQTLPIIFQISNKIFFHVYNPFYYNPFNHSKMIVLLFTKQVCNKLTQRLEFKIC